MSSSMPRRQAAMLARLRMLLQGLLCLAVLSALPGAGPRAQAPADAKPSTVSLFLSFKKDGVKPGKPLMLRPNVKQEVFVYVKNPPSGAPQSALVQLMSGSKEAPKEVAKAEVKDVPAGAAKRVEWQKAPPPAPAAAPGKAEPMEELQTPLFVRVTDKDGTSDMPIDIASANDYLKVASALFHPGKEKKNPGDPDNRLEFVIERKKDVPFDRPPSRIELEVRPDRMVGLEKAPDKNGRYSTTKFLGATTDSIVVELENLKFSGSGKGLVHLNIDGVPRALVFSGEFPPSGEATKLVEVSKPIVTTSLSRFAKSSAPVPIVIESGGDFTEKAKIMLDLLSAVKDGEEVYSELKAFEGPRQAKILYGKIGPGGGLVLQPEVKDWTYDLDLAGAGPRTKVRLRVVNDKDEDQPLFDGTKAIPAKDKDDKDKEIEKKVFQSVRIDDTPPKVVKFAVKPRPAIRGESVTLTAECADPESDVSQVVFYAGKAGSDGKMPADLRQKTGDPTKEKNVWEATFAVPRGQKEPMAFTVRAANGVGLEDAQSLSVAVVDPAATYATLKGVVYEKEAPVDSVVVKLYELRDRKAVLRQQVRSEKGGNFTFQGLYGEKYRVTARRETTKYSGEKEVAVKDFKVMVDGEELKEPLELILQPPPKGKEEGKKKARVAGVIYEGTRPQKGLTVTLTDANANKALLIVKCGPDGKYEFKDLAPGKYKVSSAKSTSNTKGETKPFDLKEGEDKTDADVKLYR